MHEWIILYLSKGMLATLSPPGLSAVCVSISGILPVPYPSFTPFLDDHRRGKTSQIRVWCPWTHKVGMHPALTHWPEDYPPRGGNEIFHGIPDGTLIRKRGGRDRGRAEGRGRRRRRGQSNPIEC